MQAVYFSVRYRTAPQGAAAKALQTAQDKPDAPRRPPRSIDAQLQELKGLTRPCPTTVVSAVISALNDRKKALQGARVLVLGLAYK